MHKKTLLATLILGLLAGQAVAAPYSSQRRSTNRQQRLAGSRPDRV